MSEVTGRPLGVRVRGPAREAPVTWGQAAIWQSIRAMGDDAAYFNLRRVVRPAEPCSVDDAVGRVVRVVAAAESLRTRFRERDGRMMQVVDAEGEPRGAVVDASGQDLEAAVAGTVLDLRREPFDVAAEWPARVGVVGADGWCHAFVLVVSHLAVDATGLDLLASALRTGQALREPWQPCDQAAFEAGPREQRRSEHNVARWAGLLAGIHPPSPVPDRSADLEAGKRFVEWSMVSAGLRRSALQVAEHCRVSYSSAVLAAVTAVAAVLDAPQGRGDQALTLISRNRVRPREQGYPGPLAQDALFRVRWDDGAPAAEFVRSVHREAVAAYAGARYDPQRLRRLYPEPGAGKVPVFFNDACGTGGGADGEAADGTVERAGSWPYLDLRMFFVLQDAGDRARLRLVLDTWAVPGADHGPRLLEAVAETAERLTREPERPLPEVVRPVRDYFRPVTTTYETS